VDVEVSYEYSPKVSFSTWPVDVFSMPPINEAACLRAPTTPLSIGPAPYTTPGPQELVIKNGAVAINPVDVIICDRSSMSKKRCPIKHVPGCLPLHSSQ
jgi:hypothetical protein